MFLVLLDVRKLTLIDSRTVYCRYDYEGVDSADANKVMDTIRESFVNGDTSSFAASDSGVKLVDAVEFR